MTKLTVARIVCYLFVLAAAPLMFVGFTMVLWGGAHDQREGALLLGAALFVATLMLLLAHKWLPLHDWFRPTVPQDLCCPTCSYNMRGLKATQCPEFGAEFTIDQLINK